MFKTGEETANQSPVLMEPKFQLYGNPQIGGRSDLPKTPLTLTSKGSAGNYQSQMPEQEPDPLDLNLPIRPYHFDLSVYKSYVAESKQTAGNKPPKAGQ
jgi:hypothetical protein